MLGQQFELPAWLDTEQLLDAQQAVAAITTTGDNTPIYTSSSQSYPLIGASSFLANPGFSAFNGSGYSIAVLDTGADLDHPAFGPDLNSNGIGDRIVYQQDFANGDMNANDVNGHGTNVAGIAAGLATGANLIILKVFQDSGAGNFAYVEQALQWIVTNASTYNIVSVNMSLGDNGNYQSNQNLYGIGDELSALAESLRVTSVAAAGNAFYTFASATGVSYPAAHTSAIAVGGSYDANVGPISYTSGATDLSTATDRIASFSQRHSTMLDIVAPGALITSAGLSGGSSTLAGTSQAAPHVAAAVAIAQQMNVISTGARLTQAQLVSVMQATGVSVVDGDDENDNVTNTSLTFKRIDVEAMGFKLYTPTAAQIAASSDSGLSNSDRITNITTPTFTGTVPANSFVRLYVDGVERGTQQLTGGNTQFSITSNAALSQGTRSVTIRVDESSATTFANLSNASAALSITIDTAGSRVDDVVVRGSGWNSALSYSFDSLVAAGKQLAPIYTAGVNTLKIYFTQDVRHWNGSAYSTLNGSELKLIASGTQGSGVTQTISSSSFSYASNIATWTFPTLPGDRYRIELTSAAIRDVAGNSLDGKWDNLTNGSLYDWTNDPLNRTFQSGTGGSGTDFKFLFALQPGDYNQNGYVDAADQVLWDTAAVMDGNGDGVETQADYQVWQAHFGNQLGVTRAQGDYNVDGRVSSEDYVVWKQNFGNTGSNMPADGNFSNVIDTGDFVLWYVWRNTVSAWYLPPAAGAASSLADSTTAPRVMNVTIGGSNSVHDPYSFASHVGSGEQLQTIPVGGADTVSITFDEAVNIEASYLQLVGLFSANLPALAEFYYDAATFTATWRFENWTPNDMYAISLSDSVTDMEGYRLDGEWTNPQSRTTTNALVSEFPSGDGQAGGNFNFVVTLLAGDANLNSQVTFDDFQILYTHYNTTTGMTFADGDFNGDGAVLFDDYQLLAVNLNWSLLSASLPGDIDGTADWIVDDADFELVRLNLGMSNPTHADGDMDGDGDIDVDDIDFVLAQYGLELSLMA